GSRPLRAGNGHGARVPEVVRGGVLGRLLLCVAGAAAPDLVGAAPVRRGPGSLGGYQRTIHVLPEIGGRMGPDLQHLVLEALSLIAAVTLTRLALTRLRASQAGVLDDDTSREVGA